MSCAHSFGEWCAECIDGLVRDYNAARQRIRELEAAPSGWQQRIAAMEQEIAELRRVNNVALCQSCTRLREIARDSEVFCTIVYDFEAGEVRYERPEGQNAVDALPPAPEVKDAKPCGMCGGTGIAKPITQAEKDESDRAFAAIDRMLSDASPVKEER